MRSRPNCYQFVLVILVLLTVAAPVVPTVPPAASAARDESPEQVAGQVQASVVTVYTWTAGGAFAPGATGRAPSGAGSGWVWTDDGLIVTNNHVVTGADKVRVVLDDGTMIPATVLGGDWYQDVAVLRLDSDDGQELPPPATVGDAAGVRAGDRVIAIGTPHGQFANTVSIGMVEATEVALNTGVGYSLRHLIRHSAALQPGNSGGPLVNMSGEVIGMNVASTDVGTGQQDDPDISFAITSDAMMPLVEAIIDHGFVARPFLGVTTDIAPAGAVVTGVVDDSPAADAGMRVGDVIVGLDGQPVGREALFIDVLYRHDPGETLILTVVRDNDRMQIEVTPVRRQEDD